MGRLVVWRVLRSMSEGAVCRAVLVSWLSRYSSMVDIPGQGSPK